MMGERIFENDLSREDSRKAYYSAFYESHGVKVYSRSDWNTKSGHREQKSDIDVTLQYGNIRLTASEKERSTYFGDIFVELEHVFEDGTTAKGWIFETKADLLSYFTPSFHFFVNMPDLKNTVINDILPLIRKQVNDFEKTDNKSGRISENIGGKKRSMTVTMARNSGNGNRWKTFGLCIRVEDLIDFGIAVDKTEIDKV